MTQPAADVTNAPIFGSHADAAPGTEYEFSEADNTVFRELAGAMRLVAVGNAVLGAVLVVSALGGMFLAGRAAMAPGITQSVAGGLAVVNYLWLREASAEVLAIATTQGSDVTHLMHAMGALRRMFTLQRMLLGVGAAVGIPGICVAVFLLVRALRG